LLVHADRAVVGADLLGAPARTDAGVGAGCAHRRRGPAARPVPAAAHGHGGGGRPRLVDRVRARRALPGDGGPRPAGRGAPPVRAVGQVLSEAGKSMPVSWAEASHSRRARSRSLAPLLRLTRSGGPTSP